MVFVPLPGILSYSHTQSTASTTWTIAHNLNKSSLAVEAFITIDGSIQTVIPNDVFIIDNNTIEIHWTTARTGSARIA
jgi:hypothetical protein